MTESNLDVSDMLSCIDDPWLQSIIQDRHAESNFPNEQLQREFLQRFELELQAEDLPEEWRMAVGFLILELNASRQLYIESVEMLATELSARGTTIADLQHKIDYHIADLAATNEKLQQTLDESGVDDLERLREDLSTNDE